MVGCTFLISVLGPNDSIGCFMLCIQYSIVFSRDADGNGGGTEHQPQRPHHFNSSHNAQEGQSAVKEEIITTDSAAACYLEPRESGDRDSTLFFSSDAYGNGDGTEHQTQSPDRFNSSRNAREPRESGNSSSNHTSVLDHQYSVISSEHILKAFFVCKWCGLVFDMNCELHKHVGQVHVRGRKRRLVTADDEANSVQSPMNSELAESDSVVDDNHEYSNVEVNDEQPSTEFGAVCEVCGYFCDKSESLATHMQTHSMHESTECGVCAPVDVETESQTMHKFCCRVTRVHARTATDGPGADQSLSCTNAALSRSLSVGQEENNMPKDNIQAICNICGWVCVKSSRPKRSLSEHIERKHSDKQPVKCQPVKCGQCSLTLASKKCLRQHETLHAGVRRFLCQYCAQSFLRYRSLLCHLSRHHADKIDSDPSKWPNRCEFCSRRFVRSCELRRHVETQHQSSLCEMCGKTTSGSSKVHNCTDDKACAGDKTYICSICGVSYTSVAGLNRHMTIHETDNIRSAYKCQLCSEQFELMTSLKKHMSATHSIFETHYQCSECTKSFSSERKLKRHMRIHSANAITCTVCSKKFEFQSRLKRHVVSHARFNHLRKFGCSVCGKRFIDKQTLEFHECIHSGAKPFVCKTCGKAFRQRGHLIQHWHTHTKKKRYCCCLCSKAYFQRVNLRNHCTRVHNVQLPVVRRRTEA